MMRGISERLAKLERATKSCRVVLGWAICKEGETSAQAAARWQSENNSPSPVLVWQAPVGESE